jgi:Trk K+ transport system NAD-binding subunit
MEFTVIKDSPLVGMTFKEAKDKYTVDIASYKPIKNNGIIQAHEDAKIKPGFIITACGNPDGVYNIFRDATGYYEIDA